MSVVDSSDVLPPDETRKMTSSDLGNGLENKSSVPRSDRQMFVALVHEDDVSNDGIDADNYDNDNASFSDNDAISSLEDEDLHNPQHAYNFNIALGESEPATETAQTGIATLPCLVQLLCFCSTSSGFIVLEMSAQNVFSNDDMEVYREHVLKHMHKLADLKRYNITKPGRSLRQALDHVPSGINKHVWEWLMKEIYSKDPYKGAKTGNEPFFLQMFRETHRKGTEFATSKIAQKYDEIRDVMENDPSLSQMEVLSLRGGIKPKDVRGSYSTRAELEVELNATRRKTEVLTDRLATVKAENEKTSKWHGVG
ncbi:hypothetical protein Cgig2_028246 [Carnegiea gigantea]|uniref:Uncharacterized protein n=1 Tax=Carnegiea gigantea TaxID=171969 RepID=A0A9Q1QHR1_9CARY|nr:hypothetical protein Cgig2_028246 [Carnegiea gigantea]